MTMMSNSGGMTMSVYSQLSIIHCSLQKITMYYSMKIPLILFSMMMKKSSHFLPTPQLKLLNQQQTQV